MSLQVLQELHEACDGRERVGGHCTTRLMRQSAQCHEVQESEWW